METFKGLTALRPGAIFLAALSLSIGWGIRGNFGHEYGAMIPGALTAIAVCLLSGRQDWRERVPYFACFGALGWGFGGSMSYMQVVSYTHSGHLPSQFFGFFGLFFLGFLWATMGGAGTAFPAVVDKARLGAIFKPLCWIFVGWFIFNKYILLQMETLFPESYDTTWSRQAAHTYWFDADWMETTAAIIALLAFELWDNREKHFGRAKQAILLPVLILVFALASLGLHTAIAGHLPERIAESTVVDAGDSDTAEVVATSDEAAEPTPEASAIETLKIYWQHHSHWIAVGAALGVVAFCFFFNFIALLPALILAGAALGFLVQAMLNVTGATPHVREALLQYQVSTEFVQTAAEERGYIKDGIDAGLPAEEARAAAEAKVRDDQLINWPNAVLFFPQHIGWFVGALIGLAIYFFRFGRFGSGASLFMYMCLGWFGSFLLFPVLLGHPFDDGTMWFRMTPPRGDNWAGILGVAIGTAIWMIRNNYIPVVYAMLVSGIIGGLGFAGGVMIKLMLVRPGNSEVETDPAVVGQWAHWQQSNWHSVLEQTYGFINGIAIAVALGLLATRVGKTDGVPRDRRWTAVFAAAFVLFGVTYLNMYKNVLEWVKNDLLPEAMTAPLAADIQMSSWGWFNLIFGLAALAGIVLMARHLKQPVALMPSTSLGKGQMLYIAFLAAVVVMNFERALPAFRDGRLITEGVIFFNAIVATMLILLLPGRGQDVPAVGTIHYGRSLTRIVSVGLVAWILTTVGMTAVIRGLYGDGFAGHAGKQYRFGDDAEWRVKPTEKSKKHS